MKIKEMTFVVGKVEDLKFPPKKMRKWNFDLALIYFLSFSVIFSLLVLLYVLITL